MLDEARAFRARTVDAICDTPFPASRGEIIAHARRHNVPSDILATLLRLPDRTYDSLAEVLAEVDRLRPVA